MNLIRLSISAALILYSSSGNSQNKVHLEVVNFSKVAINDQFWKPAIDKVTNVTIPVCIDQTSVKTPRLRNFEKVARHLGEKHEGIFYDDSDVYKALEAISYSLSNNPDKKLEAVADSWIQKIAAAQLPDGYINTYYTLGDLSKRWSDMSMHEDYNGGHLIEAAVAYYDATQKKSLLNVAIRFANHFDSLFGPGKRDWVTGHEELELALVKLYRVTHDQNYLNEAHWLIEERGHGLGKGYTWTDWKDTAYTQDVLPVKLQRRITGHAVRAMYLYTGAADVGSYAGTNEYDNAMKNVWDAVVYKNMYVTGGIGSSGNNEGFTIDYDLPNDNAYCETCASVGMVFWNQRMNLLTGESKYIDVLEKSLYNSALDGLSASGSQFFYGNPLQSIGNNKRRDWFGTACCPSNISRLIESLGNYIYAKSNNDIWVNLFIGNKATIDLPGNAVQVTQNTNYPWDGAIAIKVDPARAAKFNLRIRIPGWARGEASPGGTYYFSDKTVEPFQININGKTVHYELEKGYAVLNKLWEKGDAVNINFPMAIKKVMAIDSIKADQKKLALQRGPLIYCVEHADNNGKAMNFIVPESTAFSISQGTGILNGDVILKGKVPFVDISEDGKSVKTITRDVTAIPYYSWANRGAGQMQVWLPTQISDVKLSSQ